MNRKTKILMIILLPIVISIWVFCWMLFLSCLLWSGLIYEFEHEIKPELLEQNYYDNSIFVVTKNERNNSISYYEINDYEDKRTVDKFEYSNNELLYFNNCFESYIDRERNKVLNKRTNRCEILDDNKDNIIIDEKYDDIINKVSDLEHDIMESKMIKINDNIYVVVALNVNMWSPYKLYKYDNNKLNHLYTFDGEDVIAIKENLIENK